MTAHRKLTREQAATMPPLFPPPPPPYTLARRADPPESAQAARAVTRDGTIARHYRLVLSGVAEWPDMTAGELAARTGVERTVYGRRLPELEAQHKVIRCESRPCSISGKRAATWRLA